MKYKYIYMMIIAVSMFALACSEVNESIPTNEAPEVHGADFISPDSENFHGLKVANSSMDKKLVECQSCHASDYTGGNTGRNCINCHSGISVHSGDYKLSNHFTYFKDNNLEDFSKCYKCHGDDLSGGVVASPTCTTCHSGVDQVHRKDDPVRHTTHLVSIGRDMSSCQRCHGQDFAGKENRISPTCKTCHSTPEGPESCNTCHGGGVFGDTDKIAPGKGVRRADGTDRNTYVGAHESHMYNAVIAENLDCAECHTVPDNTVAEFDVTAHIGGDRADVIFGQIRAQVPDGADEPVYDPATLTCANTYCHGNFEFGAYKGNNVTVTWTGENQAECGSCHGQEVDDGSGNMVLSPLPVGHFGAYTKEQCFMCHGSVVDSNGDIIAPELHVNGEKN